LALNWGFSNLDLFLSKNKGIVKGKESKITKNTTDRREPTASETLSNLILNKFINTAKTC
jgi:hypothetical protein